MDLCIRCCQHLLVNLDILLFHFSSLSVDHAVLLVLLVTDPAEADMDVRDDWQPSLACLLSSAQRSHHVVASCGFLLVEVVAAAIGGHCC